MKHEQPIAGQLLIVIGIILLLLTFFLSSPRPAGAAVHPYNVVAMGNAVAIDVQLTSVWQGGDDPVPYPDWDTSAHLDGWHKLYVYQWAIGIFRAYEEAEQRAKDRVRLEEAIANPPDKWFWYGVSAFSLLLAAGWMFADKLMSAGKRLLVWSKP